MTSRRVATLSLIAGLALADVAAATYLATLWQQRHPPGEAAQTAAQPGSAYRDGAAQRQQKAAARAP